MFRGVSVIAKSSSREVEQTVRAIRGAENLHWLQVFVVVDSDARPDEEIAQLRNAGIYAVPSYSVEAIYYHVEIQRRVAQRHSAIVGGNADERVAKAAQEALRAIDENGMRMAGKVAEKILRGEVLKQLPKKQDVAERRAIAINIDTGAIVDAEHAQLQEAVAGNNLGLLITRYPVRETPALGRIAEQLGFQDRTI